MSYGFELRNNDGEIVIDGQNPCSFLHEKGIANLTNPRRDSGGAAPFWWREPDAVAFSSPVTTQEPPFIVGHAGATPVTMGPMIGRPGNWTGFLCYSPWWPRSEIFSNPSRSFVLEYAVFSRVGNVQAASGYGLQVFDAGGGQVFDSRKFPFILAGSFQYTRFGANLGTEVHGGANGYAAAGRALTESGILVDVPSANHWPLLTGLGQMLHCVGGSGGPLIHSSDSVQTAGALLKLCVERVSSTRWRYRFGAFMKSRQMDFRPRTPSYNTIPNFGGGMGAVNLLLTAPVPT